ncbi:putative two-component transcriptional regulator [Escherichia coli]|uniref:Putative two-component transcriptional regulator n=1 Tax=Escherichia coli TaxID=562 RepID=A0A377C3I7_ECOLX|nr:putative two-component transcriptional regulator [Escherichia coli]
MSFSVDVLANIAIELQRGIGHQDRFQRLITTLRQVLECDASALLRYDSRQFIPLAIDGLAKDVSVDALRWKASTAGSDCPRRGCGALSRRQRIARPL